MSEHPPHTYRRGEFATLSAAGRSVRCMVLLASPCGRSLVVGFDALVDGCAGTMPITWRDGGYANLITGALLELAPLSREDV